MVDGQLYLRSHTYYRPPGVADHPRHALGLLGGRAQLGDKWLINRLGARLPVNYKVLQVHLLKQLVVLASLGRPVDEAGLPLGVGGDETDLLQGDAPGVLVVALVLFEPDVHVDYGELQVVDDLLAEPGHHAVLLLVVPFPQLFQVLLEHIANVLLDELPLLPQQLVGRGLLETGAGRPEFKNSIDVVEGALDRGRGELGDGRLQAQLADAAVGEPEGRVQLVEVLLVEADVLELEVALEQVHRQVLAVDAVDELAEVVQDYFLHHRFHYVLITMRARRHSASEAHYNNLRMTEYQAREVVWAKVRGYPWWPAYVPVRVFRSRSCPARTAPPSRSSSSTRTTSKHVPM